MMNPVSVEKPSREDELLKQGWTRQFLASGPRLHEAIELYESMRFEVHLEPACTEDLACSECQLEQPPSAIEGWHVIYTRPRAETGGGGQEDDELW